MSPGPGGGGEDKTQARFFGTYSSLTHDALQYPQG